MSDLETAGLQEVLRAGGKGMSGSTGKRVGGIAVAIAVLAGLVFLVGESLRPEKESPK